MSKNKNRKKFQLKLNKLLSWIFPELPLMILETLCKIVGASSSGMSSNLTAASNVCAITTVKSVVSAFSIKNGPMTQSKSKKTLLL